MKWWSYGCKCGAACEIRALERPGFGGRGKPQCPDCQTDMVHLATWNADGQRYDAKGKVVAEATDRLIALGCPPAVARQVAEIMGPATETLGEAIDMIMRRKSLP